MQSGAGKKAVREHPVQQNAEQDDCIILLFRNYNFLADGTTFRKQGHQVNAILVTAVFDVYIECSLAGFEVYGLYYSAQLILNQ